MQHTVKRRARYVQVRLLVVLIAATCLPGICFAQTTGSITGVALDNVGNVVAGAAIVACPLGSPGIPCSPVIASTTSNGAGAFSMTVPVSTYVVTVFRLGIVASSSVVIVAPSNIVVANNVTYNGAVSFTGNVTFTNQITSTLATGTAPFSIASTTVVPNLNAQLHNGLTAPTSAIVGISDTQTLTNKTLTSPAITNPSTTGTDSGTETLTNKTIDISANTLKSSTNTAGHVPRNNGTQYVDGQLAAADLSDGVIGSGSIVKATALQGTDANVLTAGTVSASTGVPLCTDANHGATTSGCAASGVSEMIFSWGAVASSGGTASACNVSGGVFSCPQILLPNAHTITRFTYFLQTAPVGCSTQGVVGVWDFNNGSTLTTITVNQGASQFVDSGVISVATTAGHKIGIGWTTLPGGCSTFASILSLTAILQ